MTDFFDWLTASDSGLMADRLQERYRLSHEEMRKTSEALAPAFMLGLQRMVTDPAAWTEMMRSFASLGPDRAMPGFDPVSHPASRALMQSLFGNDALALAVARHASTMTGIAPDTIIQMMPSFTLLTVQATMRMMSGGLPTDGRSYPSDGAGQAMAEMMRRSANAVEAFSRPAGEAARAPAGAPQSAYLQSLFSDALKGGFPWIDWGAARPTPAAPQARPTPAAATPAAPGLDPFQALAPMLEAFTRSLGQPGGATPPAPPPQAAPEPAAEASADGHDAGAGVGADGQPFPDMLRLGQSIQAGYAREMMTLFERHRPKP